MERLLGSPANISYDHYVYHTDNESVTVLYSTGECKAGQDEWKVPAGVITEFWVNPIPAFEIRQLRLDPQRFQREESRVPESGNKLVTYTDKANGVIVRAKDDGHVETVISITYSPSRKDENQRCKEFKIRSTSYEQIFAPKRDGPDRLFRSADSAFVIR